MPSLDISLNENDSLGILVTPYLQAAEEAAAAEAQAKVGEGRILSGGNQ